MELLHSLVDRNSLLGAGMGLGSGPVMAYLFKLHESLDPTSSTQTRAHRTPLLSSEAVMGLGSRLCLLELCLCTPLKFGADNNSVHVSYVSQVCG